MNISDDMIEEFQRDGVVVLRGVFRDWIDELAAGVAEVMLHPSPLERSYRPQDGSAAFFQDYCNWRRIAAFRSFIFESSAAEVAARLMKSSEARFFHDHVLVKPPGNSTVTPWHQDQPYYCVAGAPANTAPRSRRVFSSRWVGADARFVRRGAAGSPPFTHLNLEDGALFDAPDFPLVYQR